jgi:hypothetical protein
LPHRAPGDAGRVAATWEAGPIGLLPPRRNGRRPRLRVVDLGAASPPGGCSSRARGMTGKVPPISMPRSGSAQYATTSPPLETHRPRIAPRVSSIFASGSTATRATPPRSPAARCPLVTPPHTPHSWLTRRERPPPRGRARSHDAAPVASSARSVAMTEPAG